MASDEDRRAALAERLGWRFADPRLLEVALTHRSYATERGTRAHYERLEFLGDAVLGLITAEWLYRRFPDTPEGELSRRRSTLVAAPTLVRHAETLGLGEELRLGVGEERSRGREKPSLLADAFEAVLGAVYLDGGLPAAVRVVGPLLESLFEESQIALTVDAKTELQELVQARGGALPKYAVVAEEGPDHEKQFRVECTLDGAVRGVGQGGSKKQAEQRAAAAALAALASAESGAEPAGSAGGSG